MVVEANWKLKERFIKEPRSTEGIYIGSVCLRSCGCVLIKTQLAAVWLKKKRNTLFMGPTGFLRLKHS